MEDKEEGRDAGLAAVGTKAEHWVNWRGNEQSGRGVRVSNNDSEEFLDFRTNVSPPPRQQARKELQRACLSTAGLLLPCTVISTG